MTHSPLIVPAGPIGEVGLTCALVVILGLAAIAGGYALTVYINRRAAKRFDIEE